MSKEKDANASKTSVAAAPEKQDKAVTAAVQTAAPGKRTKLPNGLGLTTR